MRKLTTAILAILFLLGPVIPINQPQRTLAQTSESLWSTPVNLSRTGSTRDPGMVADNDGVLHVVWQDNYAGTMYADNTGGVWSEPRALSFPFDTYTPRFIIDPRGYVGAFWVDAEQNLQYSYILAAQFQFPDSWSVAQPLGEFVLDFDVTTDAGGKPQLAYLSADTENLGQSGIFHRTSGGIGFAWEAASRLYASNYFRAVDAGTAHINISASRAGEDDLVYIAWDNRAQKQVYLSKSIDGGKTWDNPYLVDNPTVDTPTADPFRLIVHANGEVVDLVWQSGLQSGFDCTQYFQHSMDRGETWGARQIMLTDLVGCPQENELFNSKAGLTVLMTTIQDEVYLLAWDGKSWSLPQAQGILYSFVDSENFDTVSYRCRQALLLNGEDFYVVGCDTVGDGDIWLLNRKLGEITQWFPPPNAWAEPVILTSNQQWISGVESLSDTAGRLHIFWNQPDEKEPLRTGVYYSQLNEDGWLPPVRVFSSPDNRASKPSVIVDNLGRLAAVWGSTSSGEIFFSWADPAAANNPFEWADPIPLPISQKAAADPIIRMDDAGTLFVVYAIQLNEDRGIYLTSSSDSGSTWTGPVQVFDARVEGWSMVQNPDLLIQPDGVLLVSWERLSLPGDTGVVGLYSARSIDDGMSWQTPDAIVDGPLTWSKLASDGLGRIYRFWQTGLVGDSGIWYDVSSDAGETWTLPVNLTRLGEFLGATSLAPGGPGNLNLVQVLERENEGKVFLSNWVSNSNGWGESQSLELKDTVLNNVKFLSAAVVNEQELTVVYVYTDAPSEDAPVRMSLLYTSRGLDSTIDVQPILPASTQTPTTTETPILTQAVEPAATETVPATQEPAAPEASSTQAVNQPENTATPPGGINLPGGAWGGLALGVSVAVVIVVITFTLAVRRNRRTE